MGDLATAVAANIKTGPSKDWWRRRRREVGGQGGTGERHGAGRYQKELMGFLLSESEFQSGYALETELQSNKQWSAQYLDWRRQDTTCTKKYQCVAHRSRFNTCQIEGAICRAKFACHADQTIVGGHVVARARRKPVQHGLDPLV